MFSEERQDEMFFNVLECLNSFDNFTIFGSRGNKFDYQLYFRNLRLNLAVKSQNLCIQRINAILKEGANINYVDTFTNSVLHHVVKNRCVTFKVIQFLLESGANPDIRNKFNEPPLAQCKDLSSVKLFIQYTVMTKMYQNASGENCYSKDKGSLSFTEAEKILNLSFCKSAYMLLVLTHCRDSCIAEMKLMQEDMIAVDYTFFDFVAHNCVKRKDLREDKEVDMSATVEIVVGLLNNKYPSCQDIINSAIRLSNVDLTRSFNVQIYTANPSAANPAKKAIFLNAECTTEIANYLTTEDRLNLILALRHISVFKSKLCSSKRLKKEIEQSLLK